MKLSDEIQIDDETDTATICGVKVTGDLLRTLVEPTPTFRWFRNDRQPDGTMIVTCREDKAHP